MGRAGLELAKALPLSARARAAVASIDALRKYGRLGIVGMLLKDELLSMLMLLREVWDTGLWNTPPPLRFPQV